MNLSFNPTNAILKTVEANIKTKLESVKTAEGHPLYVEILTDLETFGAAADEIAQHVTPEEIDTAAHIANDATGHHFTDAQLAHYEAAILALGAAAHKTELLIKGLQK